MGYFDGRSIDSRERSDGTQLAFADAGRTHYVKGCVLVLSAGILWSFTGTLTRVAADTDAMQYLAYRSFGTVLVFLLWNRLGHAIPVITRVRAMGMAGAVATGMVGCAMICFILAMKSTSVANALFLAACAPLLSAVIGFVVLRERVNALAFVAVAVGLIGAAMVIWGDAFVTTPSSGLATVTTKIPSGSAFGNAMALGSALSFAGYIACLRRARGRDLSPVVFVSSLWTMIVAALFTFLAGEPLLPPPVDVTAAVLNGFLFMGLGSTLFIKGAAFIPAVGLTVLAQTENIFGPLWVWLFIGEAPPLATVLGGGVILLAVVLMGLIGNRSAPLPGIP
ncbi:MAG: DMT family transporter [Hyphomicrobiales bacterium]